MFRAPIHERMMALAAATGRVTWWTAPEAADSFFTDSRSFRDAASLVFRIKNLSRKDGPPAGPEAVKTQWVVHDFSAGKACSHRYNLTPELDKPETSMCALSPEGQTLCLWTDEPKGLLFWNLGTGKMQRPKGLQSMWCNRGTYSSDGSKLAMMGDRSIQIWDVAREKELLPRGRLAACINRVCFSPDGTLLALGVTGGVMVWDIAARSERRFLEGDGYGPMAFSPDGQTIAFVKDSKAEVKALLEKRRKTGRRLPDGRDRQSVGCGDRRYRTNHPRGGGTGGV